MTNPMEEVARCEGCPHEDDEVACPPGNFCRAELEDQIRKVRDLRALHVSMKMGIDKKWAAYVKENEKLLTSEAACKKTLGEEESRLREFTLATYQETGNKKPAPGVGIRIVKVCEFDPTEAKKWAIEKGACLMLDETAYKAALTKGIFDCMPGTVKEVPQATIGKDL